MIRRSEVLVLGAAAVGRGDDTVIASGEIRPGVRIPVLWRASIGRA